MKHDLSDVHDVPVAHTKWFDAEVASLVDAAYMGMIKKELYPQYPAVLQEALIRVWIAGAEAAVSASEQLAHAITQAHKLIKNAAKTTTKRRERYFDEDWWSDNEDRWTASDDVAEGVTARLTLSDMLLDIPPQQREFVKLWAIDGYTISAAAQYVGVSRQAATVWVANLRELLVIKWQN